MKWSGFFSFRRFQAIIAKEFVQMRRDRVTFAMMIGIPILLSGFMFPFRGMPVWAQRIGEALPLTHYLRIVRGILLKGNGFSQILPNLWPIALFLLIALTIGLIRYRRTLD